MGTDDSEAALSATDAVVQAVAEAKGVPPEELEQPLYDVVDPEALDSIFRGGTGHISFEYEGFLVTVDHSEYVTLEPAEAD